MNKAIKMPEDDKEKIKEADKLLKDLIDKNKHISRHVFFSCLLGLVADSFVEHKIPYELFFSEMKHAIKQYKVWWKDDN